LQDFTIIAENMIYAMATSMQNNLKHFRHRLEMSKTEFASFLNLPLSQYSRYENQRSQPNIDTLITIRDRLRERIPNLTLDDLIK